MGRYTYLGFPRDSDGKGSACSAGDVGSVSQSGRAPGKGMATHSSVLAWEIPWTEETGGLQNMGVSRVKHDLVTKPPPRLSYQNPNRQTDRQTDRQTHTHTPTHPRALS